MFGAEWSGLAHDTRVKYTATLLTRVSADSPAPRKFVAVERSEEGALLALSEFSELKLGARHDRSCHEKSR